MTAFNNEKYLEEQSKKILERVDKFNNKLYLEFGGKLVDDYHASRVLPGFASDTKLKLLMKLKERLEIIFCINAADIEKNKIRADLGITYDMDVMRLIDKLRSLQLEVNSVVITQYKNQSSATIFKNKLERRNIKVYFHTFTKGYPTDVETIVSKEGYGANPYIKTNKDIVVVTAPGPGSGKLATCLSQLYHEYNHGVKAGYAKYETFPVWNLPLKHPVNIAYEAATADLKDVNLIDYFHLEKYNEVAVNYNRDLEVFPVVKNIMDNIMGEGLYFSPTDMGVNRIGECIENDDIIRKASCDEVIRRYYHSLVDYKKGLIDFSVCERIKMLLNELEISEEDRLVVKPCLEKSAKENVPVVSLLLNDGTIILGKKTEVMSAAASCIINALKHIAAINDNIYLLSPSILTSIKNLKKDLHQDGSLLNLSDVLIALSINQEANPLSKLALQSLKEVYELEAHSSHILNSQDLVILRELKINVTEEAEFYLDKLYQK